MSDRIGNGSNDQPRQNQNESLPPSWSPFNPLHYRSFLSCTLHVAPQKLDLSQKWEYDRRNRKIAPWFIHIVIWLSLIFYLSYVDLVVIPQTHKEVNTFPWQPPVEVVTEEAETSAITNSNSEAPTELNKQVDIELKEENGIKEQETVEVAVEAVEKQVEVGPTFIDIFLGKPGHRFNILLLPFGLLLIFTTIGLSVYFPHVLGGAIGFFLTFLVGSIIQTKIFYWLTDPWTRGLFGAIRFLDTIILLMLGSKLKLYFSEALTHLSCSFMICLSFVISLTMMSTEAQLVSAATITLPMFIILVAVPAFPLLRRTLTPREAMYRKIELYVVILAPFCISALLNWWFHIAWLGDIDTPKISYKNTLAIYYIGLLVGICLLVTNLIKPYISYSRALGWSTVSLILLLDVLMLHRVVTSIPPSFLKEYLVHLN